MQNSSGKATFRFFEVGDLKGLSKPKTHFIEIGQILKPVLEIFSCLFLQRPKSKEGWLKATSIRSWYISHTSELEDCIAILQNFSARKESFSIYSNSVTGKAVRGL